MPDNTPSVVATDVKSAFASKINWTQAITLLAMIAAYFGINVPPDVQAAILASIIAISTVVTWIMRTWFTTKITTAAAHSASTGITVQAAKLLFMLCICVGLATMLSACNSATLNGDLASVVSAGNQAKQTIKSDAQAARAWLVQYCPMVQNVAQVASSTDPLEIATSLGITASAAQKQVGNVQQGVSLALRICSGSTTDNPAVAALNFISAAKTVYGWFAKS